jgi:F-type H+-transporting ATPase subunit delta
MEISSVAKRYAKALYDFAVEGNAKDAVRSDCLETLQLLEQSTDFTRFVENPTLAMALADQTLETLFKDTFHEVTLLFLHFLSSKSRLNQLRAICEVYEEHICEDLGILKVSITAAHDLSDAQLDAISQKLSVQYKKEIEAEVVIDPSLMGGFKIQIGDHIRDFSLVTKLDQFEKRVINA